MQRGELPHPIRTRGRDNRGSEAASMVSEGVRKDKLTTPRPGGVYTDNINSCPTTTHEVS
jgi:hypothetical protein